MYKIIKTKFFSEEIEKLKNVVIVCDDEKWKIIKNSNLMKKNIIIIISNTITKSFINEEYNFHYKTGLNGDPIKSDWIFTVTNPILAYNFINDNIIDHCKFDWDIYIMCNKALTNKITTLFPIFDII